MTDSEWDKYVQKVAQAMPDPILSSNVRTMFKAETENKET